MSKQITIADFINQFDDDCCREVIVDRRWPDGVICPFCGWEKVYITQRGYTCASKPCKRAKFTPTVGTIFEGTKLPLSTWFLILFVMLNNKKNISSRQVALNMGITQKSAWGITNKLRTLFYQDDILLSGTIEVDESFLGNGRRWSKWGFTKSHKAPILGLFEREKKRVVIKCVPDRSESVLESVILKHVAPGSDISTDGWMGYRNLDKWYIHNYVDHSARQYVSGPTHTNNLDGIWRQLKSSIITAHHSVSVSHVQDYCDEIAFRINNRRLSTMEKFDIILDRAINLKKEKAILVDMKVA